MRFEYVQAPSFSYKKPQQTVKRYDTPFEYTKAFIQWKYKQTDIEIKILSFDFVSGMEFLSFSN